MQIGLTFKGISSKDMPVSVKTLSRPLTPTPKTFTASAVNHDSLYDFSAVNEKGRILYEDRIFEIEIAYKASDLYALQKINAKLAAWLHGSGVLIFDDTPTVYWQATVAGYVDYAPDLNGRFSRTRVMFRVAPFSYGMEEITHTAALTAGSNLVTIQTKGSFYTEPVIKITSGSSAVVNSLSYAGSFTNLILDCRLQITTNNGARVSESGSFFELKPGENKINVTVTGAATLTVTYRPRYFWTEDD